MVGDPVSPARDFGVWVAGSQHSLLRTGYLLCGDLHRAEDVVQDALMKVAARWDRLADGDPDAYARRIITRTNISWWRRHRRERVGPTPDRALDTGDDEADRRLLLAAALARLAPGQRAVLVLRFYNDLPDIDVALGVTVGTVKRQTHDALKRLYATAPELAELTEGTTDS